MKVLFEIEDAGEKDAFVDSFTDAVRQLAPGISLTPLLFGEPNQFARGELTDWQLPEYFSISGALACRPSREAMTQLLRLQSSPGSEAMRFLALKMLNRLDFTGTFRFLEREVIAHAAILFALDLLLRNQPTLIVFRVTPHEFPQFIVSEVAKYLGIEVLHFQPCSIAPVMIPRYSSGKPFDFSAHFALGRQERTFVLEKARTQLRALQEEQQPTYMVQQRRRDRALKSFRSRLSALAQSIGWIFRDRFPTSVDFSGHSNPQSFAARVLKVLLTRSLQRNLARVARRVGRDSSLKKPFAVLALHYEPERTSLPDGLPIQFQADAALQARAFLPPEIDLVVKEHYSQQSSALRGFLGRSPLFYKLIEGFPGTTFISYNETLTNLVGEARCVFTLTGTIAIEAVLKGTPVVYFGTPWWEGMPGTFRMGQVEDFATLRSAKMPHRDDVFAFVEQRVLDGAGPGSASESLATTVERFGSLPAEYRKTEGVFVAACVAPVVLSS